MVDIVYTPISKYSSELNTPIYKTNFFSALALYGNRKCIEGSKSGTGTSKFYTVPAGKTLFIVTTYLTATTNATGQSRITINDPTITDVYVLNILRVYENTCLTSIENFSIPIRVSSGETLWLYTQDATGYTLGGIVGYELDTATLGTYS